ncbi:hypothetical protein ACN20G_23410 [Streptomyces sp. BI20]|uniref:hypothetical protein n=1 Tax=Streptomyces sp. BI20 TaxID=3403460 RepID=UPI003C759FD5
MAPNSTAIKTKVWTDHGWADGSTYHWDGTRWVPDPAIKLWDGVQWMTHFPDPVLYPGYVDGSGLIDSGTDRLSPLPAGLRLGDFVVSVCASKGTMPALVTPAGKLTATKRLGSGTWLSAVCWRYDGPGPLGGVNAVRWAVPGGGTATVANYVYRFAETRDIPITPFNTITEFTSVRQIPATSPAGNTTLYLVMTEAQNLTDIKFPTGVHFRKALNGQFGQSKILVHAGDTPGTGGDSFGDILFDTLVPSAALITIKIPGADDGKPVWVLGDKTGSVLGTTTYLQ